MGKWLVQIRRQRNAHRWGVFAVWDGADAPAPYLLEGGFFSTTAAKEARDQWSEDIQGPVEQRELEAYRRGQNDNPLI